ncbi:flagellar basal body-associated protein FliL [Campylobacter sp. LH-2024]|uniref:Flagellar basal body-associated protein FliL n=1 Tax=Campylobacter molothri TaxID=1032242 RepID=A0ACC5W315_9BACT|nr:MULTISPECIES: flagellar basal body-associated protein FliL [unclassified Campylobacter]MBZ7928757.1 flagellar basal body-associated protein FliL [Campylobacter sp. RM10542]MBZ7930061.1 flagellar basal body-associated protein FliL [Campylobacter sp. W0067]MBZ7931716.1 flagellar basal body-associated protein FliL [Campylobacter sp. RM12910]MBZ7933170.1 flagellar basal body-associated protein FliL [Campylobacter sp. RM10543]MBZ7934522.1 flagellar basal body-associated protein FliL [Campylobact
MDEELENEESKKKKGGMLVIIIVILLFVLLLSIMGVIAWLISSSSSDETKIKEAPKEEVKTSKTKNSIPTQRGSDYANIGPMYSLDPFTLNLLSDSGSRYLKCTIDLEQNSELLKPELDKKVAVIRDIIIRTLTSKTFEEISTQKGKERLKDELVGKINEILTDGFIKNVYFTDFVVS